MIAMMEKEKESGTRGGRQILFLRNRREKSINETFLLGTTQLFSLGADTMNALPVVNSTFIKDVSGWSCAV